LRRVAYHDDAGLLQIGLGRRGQGRGEHHFKQFIADRFRGEAALHAAREHACEGSRGRHVLSCFGRQSEAAFDQGGYRVGHARASSSVESGHCMRRHRRFGDAVRRDGEYRLRPPQTVHHDFS
jgi:hypothetical protein